jgi:hypothetical protein
MGRASSTELMQDEDSVCETNIDDAVLVGKQA